MLTLATEAYRRNLIEPQWLGPRRQKMHTETIRPEAHIRHNGVIIDASFKRGSKGAIVEYYVVEGSLGRFYTLDVAKEIADHRAKRKHA